MNKSPFPPEVVERVRQAAPYIRVGYEDRTVTAILSVIADHLRSEEAYARVHDAIPSDPYAPSGEIADAVIAALLGEKP